jgi:hypothetical protein
MFRGNADYDGSRLFLALELAGRRLARDPEAVR